MADRTLTQKLLIIVLFVFSVFLFQSSLFHLIGIQKFQEDDIGISKSWPANPDVYFVKAVRLAKIPEKQGKALSSAFEAIRLVPLTARYQALAGFIYEGVGGWANAKRFYEKAMRLDFMNPRYHFYLGRLLAQENEKEKSKLEFRQVLLLDEGLDYFSRIGEITGAESLFDVVPAESRFFIQLGSYFYQKRDLKKMNQAFEAAVELAKKEGEAKHFETLMRYGYFLNIYGRYSEASVQWQAALELRPQRIELMKKIGWVLEKGNRIEEACNYYQRAYDRDPLDEKLKVKLRKCP